MKDLLFIDEGNPAEISGLINFYKHRKIAEKVFLILQYQHTRYQFPVVIPVRDYILSAQVCYLLPLSYSPAFHFSDCSKHMHVGFG